MKKIINWLDEYLEVSICVGLMSAMTLIIFIQVVMRYVFQNSLSWSEELARYLFIWLVYIGISYGCKIMKHIKIDAALRLFPEKARPYVVILGDLCVLTFSVYIVLTGIQFLGFQSSMGKISPALKIPVEFISAAPMVGFALASIRTIQTIIFRANNIKACSSNGKKIEKGAE